jgi:hypothetical protein
MLPPMTFLEAAEEVLRTSKRPLSAAEITERAIHRGLLATRGKTPAATMTARLYTAPPDAPIQRSSEPGLGRSKYGSVRWSYVGRPRGGSGQR